MEATNLQSYQEQIKNGNPLLDLDRPCRVGDGILSLSNSEIKSALYLAEKTTEDISFFVPASGSGSRMFEFLYAYLNSPSEANLNETEQFLASLENLALFELLPVSLKTKIKNGNFEVEEALKYILGKENWNLGSFPKALIPFHKNEPLVLNAFQEQVLQSQKVHPQVKKIHFTVQEESLSDFKKSVELINQVAGLDVEIEFSFQVKETNSVVLDENLQPVFKNDGTILERPSGHGALLENLSSLKEEIILVKNIDNIQHWNHSQLSRKWWNVLIGIMNKLRSEMLSIVSEGNGVGFEVLNDYFQFVPGESWRTWTQEQLLEFLNRPIRVCGMVRNAGQPGGGPYWINESGVLSKQIIEKAQINTNEVQRKVMLHSTHFNPVFMALCPYDLHGNKHDLNSFMDQEKYFVVEKTHEGRPIKYMERPGLWNGSMAKWNTVFVEIPVQTFSPVKSVLDLLSPLHQGKEE